VGILDKFKKMFAFGKKKEEKPVEKKESIVADEDIILSDKGAEVVVEKEETVEEPLPKEDVEASEKEVAEVVKEKTIETTFQEETPALEEIPPVESVAGTQTRTTTEVSEVEVSVSSEEVEASKDKAVFVSEPVEEVKEEEGKEISPVIDFSSIQVMSEDERDELLAFLIKADFGVMLAEELLDIVEEYPPEEREMRLRTLLASYLPPKPEPIKIASEPPTVYYFFGVNGVGKTTTIAKFAHILKKRGKVMVIGADTFRAAATDQLGLWAEKVGVDAHLGERGADPSSVIYTGVEKAKARGYDFVLVDTAGRMSTKKNLIEELKKMERVVKKVVPDAPHESFLVLDATQGQAAFRQAKTFMEAVQVTRIILTKLDSTAKGGFIFSIWKELGLPIAFLSFGQELDDWVEYSPSVILDNLFGESR